MRKTHVARPCLHPFPLCRYDGIRIPNVHSKMKTYHFQTLPAMSGFVSLVVMMKTYFLHTSNAMSRFVSLETLLWQCFKDEDLFPPTPAIQSVAAKC